MDNNQDQNRTEPALIKGAIVAHYRIVEKIGAGGMGEIYLADDTKLNRQVALKFMPSHLASETDMRMRFTREAQAVAKLNHPNVITIHEVSEFNGRPYFVMEHITGKSLHHFAHEEQLPIDMIIEYAIQICQGLGEAHRNGITHRDIKADNIAIDNNNRIRLLDFGLAAVQGDDKLTKTGSTLGTMAYMSPEQVSGRKIDNRSDLFSLGVVLYELLAGRTPFRRENEGATLKAIIEDNPEPLTRYKADVPEKLQEIVSKLLEKDKEFRYQSAEGVIADLKRLMYDSQQSSFIPLSKTKNKKMIIPAVISAAVIMLIGVWAIFFRGTEKSMETENPVLIVLPFENLGATDDDYFADGIRYEIDSRLTTIDGMRVISQRSADKYKNTDKSIEQIGLETGADYILEATIRWDKSGEVDRVRIIPRLTKTSDNYLMWADNYEEQLVQIFEVQSEIADQIVTALGLTLVDTDNATLEDAPTTNMAAYNFYLRGLEISSHSFNMSDFTESIMMFDSAIALDSSFTLAWAQKSINHSSFNFFFTSVEASHHKNEALRAAEKSLALNPNLPSAKIAMGTYYNYIEEDYEKALESFYEAESEVTSNAELSQSIGIVYMRQGKWQDALSKLEEAVRIDPLNVRRYFYISNCLTMTRDYESAFTYLNRALVLEPSNADAAYMTIFLNLLQHGTLEFGEKSFDKITNDAGLADISSYELASASSLGLWRFIIDRFDPKEAIENVRKLAGVRTIINERSPHITQLNIGQIYDLTGHHDSALIHYDSSRIILNDIIDQGDNQYHALSELGLTYAMMGRKEDAIEFGKAGKEFLTVDECHW